MALTKTPAPGQFEDMEGGAATQPASSAPSTPTEAKPAAPTAADHAEASAKVTATTATAQAAASSSTAVAVTSAMAMALKKDTNLDSLQNVIDASMLEGIGFGAFPRITVDQGGFSRNKTDFLGSHIEIDIQSWNFTTLVTAGEKDDKEADKLVRSSYDHVNITSEGCTVAEYIQKLKAEGYENATAKKYVEIYAQLLWSEKKGEEDADEIKLIQLSVSPQSAAQWGRYLLESRMKAARGREVATRVVLGSERKTVGSNTFGVIQFGVKKPGK